MHEDGSDAAACADARGDCEWTPVQYAGSVQERGQVMPIVPGRRVMLKFDGRYIEFAPKEQASGWYEVREEPYRMPRWGEAGMLYMPMLTNGEPDLASVIEITEPIQ